MFVFKEFLIDAGHEDEDGISKNANGDTPLLLAVETSEAVATLLATRFPRCIAWKNKQGADAVWVNLFFPSSPPPFIPGFVPTAFLRSLSLFFFPPQPSVHLELNEIKTPR